MFPAVVTVHESEVRDLLRDKLRAKFGKQEAAVAEVERYPNEVMHDAQDALALRIVLDALVDARRKLCALQGQR